MIQQGVNVGLPSLIVVAGQIASGKTTLAAGLSNRAAYEHLRVRQVLRELLGGSDWDRDRLQREGASLDVRTSGRWLMEYVIERMERSPLLILDSGRTRRQVEPILEGLSNVALVYLDASEGARRARYAKAAGIDPLKRGVSFGAAMAHETEREAKDLRAMSHLVVDTDGLDATLVLDEVDHGLLHPPSSSP